MIVDTRKKKNKKKRKEKKERRKEKEKKRKEKRDDHVVAPVGGTRAVPLAECHPCGAICGVSDSVSRKFRPRRGQTLVEFKRVVFKKKKNLKKERGY